MSYENIIDQVLEVSRDYLGPAAERFLDRQITTHLKKQPEKLTANDLKKIIDWLKLSMAVLTDNSKLVDEYALRLELIARGEARKALAQQWTAK